MITTVRFAPSPTGRIHLGNVRTAVLNWCFARRAGGRFVLRFDDTDRERSRAEFAAAITQDLHWLGIEPDLTVSQSDRSAGYDAAADALRQAGRLYPAYETEEELELRRGLARASGRPPVYDRAALKLTDSDRARLEREGRRPHWRFLLDPSPERWDDMVRGDQSIDAASLSDPVLLRADGTPLYTFTSVVDDIALGVTHVIRGEDHVANTAVQLQLFRALGARPPTFGHHNLLVAASGAGLSKRDGALSVARLRADGIEPAAVAAYAALIGSAEAVRPVADLGELAALVDLARLSRSPAHVDEAELAALSVRVVHALDHAQVAARLDAMAVGGGAAFWAAVRPNLQRVADAAIWWRIASAEPLARESWPEEGADILAAALDTLPDDPWDGATWQAWTREIAARTGCKGRALYRPLRVALTGRDAGPDMAGLLPFIGAARAGARLAEAAARIG